MSTQRESDDLDRTDELPVLDLAAYEADRARGAPDALSSTDTWLAASLRDPESSATLPPTQAAWRNHPTRPLITGSADLSINVDRLQQRIATLESELQVSRAAHTELESLHRSLGSNYGALETRAAALATDTVRLGEQQAISLELTQRLQKQLHEQAQGHQQQLTEIAALREADRLATEQQRLSLGQQLERSNASYSELVDQQAKLKRALEESSALAAARSLQLDELQHSLIEEHGKTDALGRNLAATLADHDVVSALAAKRNATIVALECVRDDLHEELESALTGSRTLAQQLVQANHRALDIDRYKGELAVRDGRVVQLNADIERLTRGLQESGSARHETEQALSDALARAAREEQQRLALSAERDELRAALQSLGAERDQLLLSREQLAGRTSELESVSGELASVRNDAAALWTELQTQSHVAHTRQEELAAAQQALQDLRLADEALQRSLNEARQSIERLNASSRDDNVLLNERSAQLQAAGNELAAQAASLNEMAEAIRARDSQIEDLRAQARTAQDERTVISDQLVKARGRVKLLAQQIFNRDSRIAALKADLAVHTEALAAIRRDVERIDPGSAAAPSGDPPERLLEPVGHDAEPIVLNRRVMTIGRTNDNDIFIPSKMISRHHARLLIGPNAVIVEDAGSTNGSYVNDQRVKQHVLREGDVLAIGDLKFRLTVRASDKPQPQSNVVDFNHGRRQD